MGAKGGGMIDGEWILISYQRAGLLMRGKVWQGHGVDQKRLLYLFGPLHQQLLSPSGEAEERNGRSHLNQRPGQLPDV
jgi:hypothetical protein